MLALFEKVWVVDTEFHSPEGHLPQPICLIAKEVRSGQEKRIWLYDTDESVQLPFQMDEHTLVVVYYAPAELGCFSALGWEFPTHIIDLFAEFRNLTNGRKTATRASLLGACKFFGVTTIATSDFKDEGRALAIRGGPYHPEEERLLLEYCATDVKATAELYAKMVSHIDMERALIRGRYMKAVTLMRDVGVPIDTIKLKKLRNNWSAIKNKLIEKTNDKYDVYEGSTFKVDKFVRYLGREGLDWPLLPSGRPRLDDDTFSSMCELHPKLRSLKELRSILGQMRNFQVPIGPDGRNRTMLSAFRTKTGRNAPSTSKFIFGLSRGLRHLIRPPKEWGQAYIDWSQQEFGIAAALSGDQNMLSAYHSGDPYLATAIYAGSAPPNATKETHKEIRQAFKAVVLGVQYGMGEKTLAKRLGSIAAHARELLQHHRTVYKDFWFWLEGLRDYAFLNGHIHTTFGWRLHVDATTKPRTVLNFPMQANGAEMLRLACIRATESGVRVCAPIHDALLIEAPLLELEEAVATTQEAMKWASREVLGGFELSTDVQLIRYPERFRPDGGESLWQLLCELLEETSNSVV